MSGKINKIKGKLAVLMLFVMVASSFAGCGKTQTDTTETENKQNEETQGKENPQPMAQEEEKSDVPESPDKSTAMGRYVESTMDLSEYCLNTLEF